MNRGIRTSLSTTERAAARGEQPGPRVAVVKSSTVWAAKRMDAGYLIEVANWLKQNNQDETPGNVKKAIQGIRERDDQIHLRARELRANAAELTEQARDLDDAAALTYPVRRR